MRETFRFFYTSILPLVVRKIIEDAIKGPYHKVFDEKKFIFIHIPKTAGKSIASLVGLKGACHLTYMQYREIIGSSIDSYDIFTVVRNPLDRLVSAYNYLSDGGNGSVEDRAFKRKWLASCGSFDEFVVDVLKEKEVSRSAFFRPQVDFIWNESGLKPDNIKIIYFESLAEGVFLLPERIVPNDKTVPHINKSRTNRVEVVSSEVALLIYSFYKDDYDFLGYKVGPVG